MKFDTRKLRDAFRYGTSAGLSDCLKELEARGEKKAVLIVTGMLADFMSRNPTIYFKTPAAKGGRR